MSADSCFAAAYAEANNLKNDVQYNLYQPELSRADILS
jgi:hypothetical protein